MYQIYEEKYYKWLKSEIRNNDGKPIMKTFKKKKCIRQ